MALTALRSCNGQSKPYTPFADPHHPADCTLLAAMLGLLRHAALKRPQVQLDNTNRIQIVGTAAVIELESSTAKDINKRLQAIYK